MADFIFLLKGIGIGVSIAAPVGPIGVLCIKRTLAGGRRAGLITGMGAATADMFYGLLAASGLTFITSFLMERQIWLQLVGGVFLCVLGFRILRSPVASGPLGENKLFNKGNFFSAFIMTLTNPMTILSFMAIFAGLGLAGQFVNGNQSALFLVFGVFLGSAAWWLTLSTIIGMIRNYLEQKQLIWINRLSATIIIFLGSYAIFQFFANS